LRVCFGEDGSVKVLDDKGKESAARKGTLQAAREPALKPDVGKLVVLSLPYRSREHVLTARKIKGRAYNTLSFADALDRLAADVAGGEGEEARKLFKEAFHGREQRQLGLYVLLAAAGQNLDSQNLDVLAEHPDEPLAQYLALHSSPVLR